MNLTLIGKLISKNCVLPQSAKPFITNGLFDRKKMILIFIFVIFVLVVLGAIIFGMKLRSLHNKWQNQQILQGGHLINL